MLIEVLWSRHYKKRGVEAKSMLSAFTAVLLRADSSLSWLPRKVSEMAHEWEVTSIWSVQKQLSALAGIWLSHVRTNKNIPANKEDPG